MRGVKQLGVALLCVASSLANAADFSTNGSLASSIEAAIDKYILPKEVQDFAFFIYQQPRNYGDGGQETENSDPRESFVLRHKAIYCSKNVPAEVAAFSCSRGSSNGTDEAQYLELGDIKASVLLEPTVYTQNLDIAAQNYIRNVVMPFPDPKFKDYEAKILKGRPQKEYADYLKQQATIGTALYSLNDIYARRLPGSTYGLSGQSASASLLSVMENEATRRFQDGNFANSIDSADQLTVMKEMAKMAAFQLWMDYQTFRQNERIEALLAASLAKFVNNSIAQDKLVPN